jgi:chromatin segregation and condensation protein Rec8/ScpA/Scc1 (kleisin family)
MQAVDALGPEDLPRSGRLLFFASVLIRMKAQYLAGRTQELLLPPPAEEGYQDGEMEWGEGGDPGPWEEEGAGLGARRLGDILLFPRQRIRKRRPITIQDLLEALECSEAHERKMVRERERRGERKQAMPFKSVKEAMEVLHQDDLTGDIASASRLVRLAFDTMDAVPLDHLAGSPGRAEGMDQVSAFLALLFLAARGEVDLEQDSFYGPVRVRRPAEGSAPVRVVPRDRFVPVKRKTKEERAAEEAARRAAEGLPPLEAPAEPGEAATAEPAAAPGPPPTGPEVPADPVAAAALQALMGLRRPVVHAIQPPPPEHPGPTSEEDVEP